MWQGRVCTKEELYSICGLGQVDGLKGAYCRHDYFPFIQAVSERVYTDEQLDEMNAKENIKTFYNGKGYTPYEATQQQRKLERNMRAIRQKIKLLEAGGADQEDIISAKCKYKQMSKEYADFSKAMGLPEQRQRVHTDGLGTINALKNIENSGKSAIIKGGQLRITQIRASIITEKINNGEIATTLSGQQFLKHKQGSKQFESYKNSRLAKHGNPQSIIYIDEEAAQKVIKEKAGTGIVKTSRNGDFKPVEEINCGFVVGAYFGKGEYHETTKAAIHYGKKTAHIVPIRGENFD